MNILKFDIRKGIYLTEIDSFTSDFHEHPAMEIILAETGTFTLSIKSKSFAKLKFAIIDSNVAHKVSLTASKTTFLLVEYHDTFLRNYFSDRNLKIIDGLYLSENSYSKSMLKDIISAITSGKLQSEYDPRIQQTIDLLNKSLVNYFDLKEEIKKIIPLSDSRLSHLFKQNTGLSLKKYLVWCRLKHSIDDYLNRKEELLDAFLSNGFYDQPHFNKSYKSFIGSSPVRTYKSRILQEIPRRIE